MTKPRLLVAVVDDEQSVRTALRRLLRSAGLEVETFASGDAFLESLKATHPTCVVLDLHMPGLDGFAVLARLAEARVALSVVVITGHDTSETHERVMASGASAYLRKPVDGQMLLDAIQRAVAQR